MNVNMCVCDVHLRISVYPLYCGVYVVGKKAQTARHLELNGITKGRNADTIPNVVEVTAVSACWCVLTSCYRDWTLLIIPQSID